MHWLCGDDCTYACVLFKKCETSRGAYSCRARGIAGVALIFVRYLIYAILRESIKFMLFPGEIFLLDFKFRSSKYGQVC